jgi:hypothetical protein
MARKQESAEVRIEHLERALRRQRRVGAVALLAVVALGAARQQGAEDLEARSLTIVDAAGRPLARLAGRDCGRLELRDAEGRMRVWLGDDPSRPGTSWLSLSGAAGGAECELAAGPGRSADLLMSLPDNPRTSIWATLDPDESRMSFEAGGFPSGLVLGARKDDELFGGRISMQYGRPFELAGETAWGSKGTYFRVSPDERVDRPADQIRRMVPD